MSNKYWILCFLILAVILNTVDAARKTSAAEFYVRRLPGLEKYDGHIPLMHAG
jgi:hypothetical protein